MSSVSSMSLTAAAIGAGFDQLDRAATRVATPDDNPEIAESFSQIAMAKRLIEANVRVLQIGDEMVGSLLDLLV